MGTLYAATLGQSPGVARICIYIYRFLDYSYMIIVGNEYWLIGWEVIIKMYIYIYIFTTITYIASVLRRDSVMLAACLQGYHEGIYDHLAGND